MDTTDFRCPLDDDFYVVDNEVAITILKDGIYEYEWYMTYVGEIIMKYSGPEFRINDSGNDELLSDFSPENADDKNIKLICHILRYRYAGVIFHIKIPEREISMFMLKYGGIVKKSPTYVYRIGNFL